jgi:hypothetical protein
MACLLESRGIQNAICTVCGQDLIKKVRFPPQVGKMVLSNATFFMTRLIFVTGGVVSSLAKASLPLPWPPFLKPVALKSP